MSDVYVRVWCDPPPGSPSSPKNYHQYQAPSVSKAKLYKNKQKQQTNKKRLSRGTFCKVRLIRRRRRRRISKKQQLITLRKRRGKKEEENRKKKERKKENISSTFWLKRIRLCLTKHKNTGLLAQGPTKQSNRLLLTTLARVLSWCMGMGYLA